jgi:cytoskeletal protein RodZ
MNENIGSLLKKAREELGYTLEDVAQETKIQKRYIIDLEEENYDDMPGKIYEKGFLKTYATLLGLDVDEVIELYSESRGETSTEEILENSYEEKSGKSTLLFVGLGISLVVAYFFYSTIINKNEDKVKNTVVENIQLEEKKVEEKNEDTIAEIDKKEEVIASEEAQVVELEEKKEEKIELVEEKEPILKEKAVEVSTEIEKKELILNVKGKSWVEVYVNGKKKFYNMAENRKIKVEAKKDEVIKIKVGDSSKVEASYNGNNIGVLGSENQVVKKTF